MSAWLSKLLVGIGLSSLVCLGPVSGVAADGKPAEKLKDKEAEVQRLQEELSRAKTELNQLREENERLKKERPRSPRVSAAAAAPAKPVPPLHTLPPLQPGDVVEVADLVGHYQADPAGASQRYDKRMLRLKGTVARFDTKLVLRNYEVLLESDAPGVTVVCSFNYIDQYRAVFTKQRGQVLAARRLAGGEVTLGRIGDSLTLEGRCRGLKDGQLSFTGCAVVR